MGVLPAVKSSTLGGEETARWARAEERTLEMVGKVDMVVGKAEMVVGKVVNKAKGVERLHQKAGCALMSRIVTGAGLKRRNILKTRSLRLRISYVSADAYSSLVRQQHRHPQQQQQYPQALQMQSQLQLQA